MAKQFHVIALMLFLVVPGCRSKGVAGDDCKYVTCQNGGVCVDGGCVCPDGYSGVFCETLHPGFVKGMILPSLEIDLTLSSGTSTSYKISLTHGQGFLFTVPPGKYVLHFDTHSAYYPSPPDMNVVVKPGDTTELGMISVSYNADAQTGSIAFSLDGGANQTFYKNDVSGDYSFVGGPYYHYLSIGGIQPGAIHYSISLSKHGVTGTGSYPLNNSDGFQMIVAHWINSANDGWYASKDHTSGNVNITLLDSITQKCSGTFSGDLYSFSADTVHISGAFTNIYFGD